MIEKIRRSLPIDLRVKLKKITGKYPILTLFHSFILWFPSNTIWKPPQFVEEEFQ